MSKYTEMTEEELKILSNKKKKMVAIHSRH